MKDRELFRRESFRSRNRTALAVSWTLNLEATGLDLYRIQSNPVSLWLNDAADSGPFCFDIYNAVIGNPIAPPAPVVRKGVRR